MADPYWRYASNQSTLLPTPQNARAAFPGFLPSDVPGYLPSDVSAAASHAPYSAVDRVSQDHIHNKISIGSGGTAGLGGIHTGPTSIGGFSRLEDSPLIRREASLAANPAIPDIHRSTPLKKSEALRGDESNVLFVGGLPNDATRREVGHLFRPFIGFKELKLIHKEPRRSGDKARALCFVEFADAKCAITALDALQGYKFDEKKPDAPVLKIQFAHFPFRISSQDVN